MAPIAEPVTDEKVEVQRPWQVILFNDDWHTFDQVILQVQKATGCSLEDATLITLKAHTDGQAVCFSGPLERCEIVAGKLQEIKLNVRIERA